MTVQKSQYRHW